MFLLIFLNVAREGNAGSIAGISLEHEKEDEGKTTFA